MRITSRSGDPGGTEMRLATHQIEGRTFAYFLPPGTNKVQPNAPHFITGPGTIYGDFAPLVDSLNLSIEEFVNPSFADREELTRLRAENAELRRGQIGDAELEVLRAGCAELELYQAEERERAKLKDRQAVLDTPHAKRPSIL